MEDLISDSPSAGNNPSQDLDFWKLGYQTWENDRLTHFCCSNSDWDLSEYPLILSLEGSSSSFHPCQTECLNEDGESYELTTLIPESIGNL